MNTAFIRSRLGEGWLDIREVPSWKGHQNMVSKAAEDRGLTVTRSNRLLLIYDGGRCIGGLEGLLPSVVGTVAKSVCSSKARTRNVLEGAGIPVPQGRSFTARTELEEARKYAAWLPSARFVVKPVDGAGGRGVTTGLTAEVDLEPAWAAARKESKKKRLLIEEEVPGLDLRIYVVDGAAVCAAVRIPCFLYGDGRSTLEQLRDRLVEARARHAYLNARGITVDPAVMDRQGLDWETVLPAGEVAFLNGKANVSQGAVTVDVTQEISAEILGLAERAAAAVPGLNTAGVDVLTPALDEPEGARVIELNTSANLSINDLPAYGDSYDLGGTIVEAMLRHNNASHRTGCTAP